MSGDTEELDVDNLLRETGKTSVVSGVIIEVGSRIGAIEFLNQSWRN